MTDITITLPISKDQAATPARGLTWVAAKAIAAVCGLVAALAAYARAVEQAHCGPFQTPVRDRKHGFDEDLEGRDPNW